MAEPESRPHGAESTGPDPDCKRTALELTEALALPAGLYLVATPIGNLRDVSLRALDVLRAADIVACEDTRRTRPLLTHFGISASLTAHHDHNEAASGQNLVRQIAGGKSVALVSDAGMPLVSDPGFGLVAAVRAAGLPVTSIPGPSAPLAALQLSGLASDRFCFAGFLPPRQGARKRFLSEFIAVPASLIFFESPRRLAASLADMATVFGSRPACVARELTKMHEQVRTGSLPDLAAAYAEEEAPRGEIVVIVDRPADEAAGEADGEARLDGLLTEALGRQRLRDAVAEIAAITGLPRRQVYDRALALKDLALKDLASKDGQG